MFSFWKAKATTEPKLLCTWCGGPVPGHRASWLEQKLARRICHQRHRLHWFERMNAWPGMLTDHQKNLINLIKRSQPREDGWYKVSKPIWSLQMVCTAPLDLFEKTPTEDGGGLIRFTNRGQAVADYL